ncbi:response regulator transcription factor [Fluviispira sanaruensis]|uniref:Response regulatory domain-containing protein n=1 Tax=Fluviispira sanaruensis TaxID=2493639 RepID=A0A4P2W0F7_FLUSA|nr:response regulator [Fluviispira sanaruensis]BBH54652.1 hypothetical protein JCM31447_31260 [Fluviispira sanaruensis]
MSDKTILIIDDCDFERSILVKGLKLKGGYSLIEAKSGEECLELISQTKISIILMDIIMPGILGSEVLKKIRIKFNPIELPVIMITSKSETSDIIDCLQNGANDYITKPINLDIAMSRISIHLKITELSNEMAKLKEIASLNAVITTYNHEINNALSIAISCFNGKIIESEVKVEKLLNTLWRIADIVKKIKIASEKKEIEYEDYTESSKMLKIHES